MDADEQGSKCRAHVCTSTTGHKICFARRCGVAFELSGSSVSSPGNCVTTSHQSVYEFLAPLSDLSPVWHTRRQMPRLSADTAEQGCRRWPIQAALAHP